MKNHCHHFMLDLETLGTGARAVVIEAACVQFNIATGEIVKQWTVAPSWYSQTGRKTDASTLAWWFARAEKPPQGNVPIEEAAEAFYRWFTSGHDCKTPEVPMVWANSPSFDCAIWKDVLTSCGIGQPWEHWQERDFRTAVALAKDLGWKRPEGATTAHRALDDCKAQVRDLVEALRVIRRGGTESPMQKVMKWAKTNM